MTHAFFHPYTSKHFADRMPSNPVNDNTNPHSKWTWDEIQPSENIKWLLNIKGDQT